MHMMDIFRIFQASGLLGPYLRAPPVPPINRRKNLNLKKAWLVIPRLPALALTACAGGASSGQFVRLRHLRSSPRTAPSPRNPLTAGPLTSKNGGGKT